jgi:hypothetical protein
MVYPQLADAIANGLRVAKCASFQPPYAHQNSLLTHPVAQPVEPRLESARLDDVHQMSLIWDDGRL